MEQYFNEETLTEFFSGGFYEQYWGWELTDKESEKYAEKSQKLLEATRGHLLDWCGGWGRLSIHYARKGFKITLLDFTKEYLDRAYGDFVSENLDITTIHADCRETPLDIDADYALCSFCSVGFVSDEDQIKAFSRLSKTLKPGAKLLLDCVNLLFLAKNIISVWERPLTNGGMQIQRSELILEKSILKTSFEIYDNKKELVNKRLFNQRMYTPTEIKSFLNRAGFSVDAMYSNLDKAPLSLDEPQIFLIAHKKDDKKH